MPQVKPYRFAHIFNATNDLLTPNFNIRINGVFLEKGTPILVGTDFGGLNLYKYVGRTIAGMWDQESNTLDVVGFYKK